MNKQTRRAFLRKGLITGASTLAGAALLEAAQEKEKAAGEKEEEVSRRKI